MKHLTLIMMATVLVGIAVFTSCSKDNESPVVIISPSRVIEQVKIYKGQAEEYKLATVIDFKYDSTNGRLVNIESGSPLLLVNYSYGNSDFSYTHAFELADGTKEIDRVKTMLENGRMNICSSELLNNCVYFYKNGYLSQASIGGSTVLNYEWAADGLIIKATPDIYSATYKSSDVPNNYSIDINIFPQLVDSRKDFSLIMSSYSQAAGVLGTKSSTVLEPKSYTYDYSFDKNRRLSQLTITPDFYADTYTFTFKYRENR